MDHGVNFTQVCASDTTRRELVLKKLNTLQDGIDSIFT
jgi:hypothetical protein